MFPIVKSNGGHTCARPPGPARRGRPRSRWTPAPHRGRWRRVRGLMRRRAAAGSMAPSTAASPTSDLARRFPRGLSRPAQRTEHPPDSAARRAGEGAHSGLPVAHFFQPLLARDGPLSRASRHCRQQLLRINGRLQHGRASLRHEVPARHHYRADPAGRRRRRDYGRGLVDCRGATCRRDGEGARPARSARRARMGCGAPVDARSSVAAGPRIRAGRTTLPMIDNVDVYPLMAELLGLWAAEGIDG